MALVEVHTPLLPEPLDSGTDVASDNDPTATTLVSLEGDTDSAYDSDEESTCTLPDIPVIEEGGRTYHNPKTYPLPNDEKEQRRLGWLHCQWLVSQDEKLQLCPQKGFRRVLDIGTGTGEWAIQFADKHPEAYIIGVDISPIQPEFVPSNCEFQLFGRPDDAESEWTWRKPFDFIYGRMLGGCFTDLTNILGQAFRHLEPGGYLEIKDILLTPKCDDGTLRDNSPLLA